MAYHRKSRISASAAISQSGVPDMAETNSRIIWGNPGPDARTRLDLIQNIIKSKDRIKTNGQYRLQDTHIREESRAGMMVSIRAYHIPNPPPPVSEVFLPKYMSLKVLEISSIVSIKWVFALASHLPSLELVRFTAATFSQLSEPLPSLNQHYMAKECPSVKEMHIRYDPSNSKPGPNGEYRYYIIGATNAILDQASKYFRNMTQCNFEIPLEADLDQLLHRLPQLKINGKQKRYDYENNMVYFTAKPKPATKSHNDVAPPNSTHHKGVSNNSHGQAMRIGHLQQQFPNQPLKVKKEPEDYREPGYSSSMPAGLKRPFPEAALQENTDLRMVKCEKRSTAPEAKSNPLMGQYYQHFLRFIQQVPPPSSPESLASLEQDRQSTPSPGRGNFSDITDMDDDSTSEGKLVIDEGTQPSSQRLSPKPVKPPGNANLESIVPGLSLSKERLNKLLEMAHRTGMSLPQPRERLDTKHLKSIPNSTPNPTRHATQNVNVSDESDEEAIVEYDYDHGRGQPSINYGPSSSSLQQKPIPRKFTNSTVHGVGSRPRNGADEPYDPLVEDEAFAYNNSFSKPKSTTQRR